MTDYYRMLFERLTDVPPRKEAASAAVYATIRHSFRHLAAPEECLDGEGKQTTRVAACGEAPQAI